MNNAKPIVIITKKINEASRKLKSLRVTCPYVENWGSSPLKVCRQFRRYPMTKMPHNKMFSKRTKMPLMVIVSLFTGIVNNNKREEIIVKPINKPDNNQI